MRQTHYFQLLRKIMSHKKIFTGLLTILFIGAVSYASFYVMRYNEQKPQTKIIEAVFRDFCAGIPYSPGMPLDEHHLTRGRFFSPPENSSDNKEWYSTYDIWIQHISRSKHSCRFEYAHRFPLDIEQKLLDSTFKAPSIPQTITELDQGGTITRSTYSCIPLLKPIDSPPDNLESRIAWSEIQLPSLIEKLKFTSNGYHYAGYMASPLSCSEFAVSVIKKAEEAQANWDKINKKYDTSASK